MAGGREVGARAARQPRREMKAIAVVRYDDGRRVTLEADGMTEGSAKTALVEGGFRVFPIANSTRCTMMVKDKPTKLGDTERPRIRGLGDFYLPDSGDNTVATLIRKGFVQV